MKQLIERASTVGTPAGRWVSPAADCLSRQSLRRSSRHRAKPWRICQEQAIYAASRIRQVAEIVQCGEPAPKLLLINNLQDRPNRNIELPQPKSLIRESLAITASTAPHRVLSVHEHLCTTVS